VTQVDAKKMTLKETEALALVREVDEIYASKGKQVIHLDLRKEKPDRAALLGLLLGPTGNLRAPTLRKGRTLLVGFDEASYTAVLK
jgi:arsenate reductase-like glutaredoxin family protein